MIFDEAFRLFGVADGVGGLPGGGEAAQETTDVILRSVKAGEPEADIDLKVVVQKANDAVVALGMKMSPGLGIGSTLTFGCVRGGRLRLAHVGDSRAFSYHKGALVLLTEDHSVENEAKRRRARGEVVYYSEAQRNALTRCIGQPQTPEADVSDYPLMPGSRFLFCTDGITRVVTEPDMKELFLSLDDPREIVRALVTLAVKRGGPDNATAVTFVVDEL